MSHTNPAESRIAVLVDCDNTAPDVLEHALRFVDQFGRIVLQRGYGNHSTLVNKWQEALVRLAFTPCMQFQYAAGKNTSDIALALDAQEAMLDRRADIFCLVTSDSDFVYLCRKLRERGAQVLVVGEAKTPAALRNASDQFFEWVRPAVEVNGHGSRDGAVSRMQTELPTDKGEAPKAEPVKPVVKLLPKFVVEAVERLLANTSDGKVHLGSLGQHLKSTDPAFSPKTYGHAGLLDMLRTYDLLVLQQESGGHWTVRLKPGADSDEG